MVIEINLLPKKERKSLSTVMILLSFLLPFMIGSAYILFQYQTTKAEINSLQSQLQTTKELRIIQEQKLAELTSTSAVDQLKTTIEWVEKLPISTVTLLKHLTALLPERGFILNMRYADSGTVTITVQFDTNRETAYYLRELEDSEVIESVQLKSVKTSGEELEKTNPNLKDKLTKVIVPRYIAVYELQLNRPALKALEKKEAEL
ncbi:PilN domain-containing protein [Calidifontibacillus erzurumensis]|uniref:Fimbrial protein n=1 Tax=Calidifontibacillus erzurumensis TaxID=2741433 RepID=A0A8J8KB67_9BACI|nr:PilN domain-containing protein [Calidifontibacillus erzurumensis]NSL51609.1 fimbrial protein [Calidifontibacillus erzurumensis]